MGRAFEELCEYSYCELLYLAEGVYDKLVDAVGFDKVLDILCVVSALDNSVNPMEHKIITDLLNDRSGLDAFVRLVNSYNTNYMIESTKSFIKSQPSWVRDYVSHIMICICAAKKYMSKIEQNFIAEIA